MTFSLSLLNPFHYLPDSLNPFASSEPMPTDRTVYFDYCTMQYWKLTTPTLIQTYTQDLMQQFKTAHVTDLSLAFAQLSNINDLANKTASSPQEDLFGYIITQYPDVFSSFIEEAHNQNLKVSLSFGGQTTSPGSFTICQPGETPEDQASKLMSFLTDSNLDGINFDLEGDGASNIISQNETTLLPFLSALHQALSASNKTLTLTAQANHNLIQTLSKLFFNNQGEPIFKDYFDGLYLMNYDNGSKYYIDSSDEDATPKSINWGMQKWIDTLSKDEISRIHIGFQDATPYENPLSSAGKTYSLDTSDRSKAAYEIYEQLKQDLQSQGYPNTFAPPFFWPDESSMASRYAIDASGKGDFQLEKIQKFYECFEPSYR